MLFLLLIGAVLGLLLLYTLVFVVIVVAIQNGQRRSELETKVAAVLAAPLAGVDVVSIGGDAGDAGTLGSRPDVVLRTAQGDVVIETKELSEESARVFLGRVGRKLNESNEYYELLTKFSLLMKVDEAGMRLFSTEGDDLTRSSLDFPRALSSIASDVEEIFGGATSSSSGGGMDDGGVGRDSNGI